MRKSRNLLNYASISVPLLFTMSVCQEMCVYNMYILDSPQQLRHLLYGGVLFSIPLWY